MTWAIAYDLGATSDWEYPWPELDVILNLPQFQAVRFCVGEPNPDGMEEVRKLLHRALPMAAKRGVIFVEQSSVLFRCTSVEYLNRMRQISPAQRCCGRAILSQLVETSLLSPRRAGKRCRVELADLQRGTGAMV